MSGVRRGLVTLVLAVLLVAGGTATGVGAVGADGPSQPHETMDAPLAADQAPAGDTVGDGEAALTGASGATTELAQATDAIRLDQMFSRTPADPGSVSVELRYSMPDRVVSLGTTVPVNATVSETTGFVQQNDTYYTWDGQAERPTLTYEYPVNRTATRSGPKAANGSYLAVDTGEWALFTRPDASIAFQYTGEERPAYERTAVVNGEGAAGEVLVYLGPEDTFTREANDQTFQLVVPSAASMAESPREVLGSLVEASDRLRVGDRDEEVFVVAAPTDGVSWAVRGLQTGEGDMWVRDAEGLSDPDNVWLHEYVHTRQDFATDVNARWLEEALPSYYAALFTFEYRAVTFDEFARRLARGNRTEYDDVILSTPSTWGGFADYYKGGLATGQLDRRIRLASEGNRSMQTVFAALNAHDQVNESDFLSEVERAGGVDTRRLAANVTQTQATLSMWNRSAHRSAYGALPARLEYALPDADSDAGYRIDGPYRTVSATPDSPIEFVTGETLAIDVRVRNEGGTAGTYDATLRINDTSVASESGSIAPNGTAIVTLEHRFVLPGRYVASVDGESVPLRVREPVTATVTNLTVEPTEVRQGESAVATVTVRNFAEQPAERELIVTRDFLEVARETVHLGANEVERVEFPVGFPRAGTARVGVNSRSEVDVSVAPAPIDTETPTANGTATATAGGTTTETSEESGTGFGAVVAVVAVVAVACWALLARRRE